MHERAKDLGSGMTPKLGSAYCNLRQLIQLL